MTQFTSSPNEQNAIDASPRGDDPAADSLSHLHHMSRTAGLGSGDYVAINVISIIAVILGIASALVVVDPLFLVLPIAGIVLSIIAALQVHNSNGTQTGMPMAIIGLVLSLGFFGYKAGGQTFEEFRTRADRGRIDLMLGRFGQDLGRGDKSGYADAYSMFNSAFTGRVPLAKFEGSFKAARASQFFGPIGSIESNGQMKFETDPRTGETMATSIAIVHLAQGEHPDEPHWMMVFRKEAGDWHIEDMPELFPNEKANPQAGGGAPGAPNIPSPLPTPAR